MKRRIVAASGLLVLAGALIWAQRTTATVFISVVDPSGAAVPTVSLRLTQLSTGAVLEGTTDAEGNYTFPFVPAGEYSLTAEGKGFRQYRDQHLRFSAGQQVRLQIPLELGASTEVVTVTAEAPLVENSAPVLADRFDKSQLSELPQTRRDFAQLLVFQNGYAPSRQGLIQFNGLASGGNSVTVDGTDGSSDTETPSTSTFQGFNLISVISQEAIQEVAVSKGTMSAEIARTFSTNINVITKSGSNDLHGSLFHLWQNDVLNAKNAIQGPGERKPVVRLNQFGGSLGGPILRNRMFFFGVYEGYRMSNQGLVTGQTPTAEFRAQAIQALPAFQAVLDLFPLPTEPFAAGAAVGVFRGLRPTQATDDHFVGRIDNHWKNRDFLAVRYVRDTPDRTEPRYLFNPRLFIGITNNWNVNWIHGAAAYSNELRFGHNRNSTDRTDSIHRLGIPAVELQGLFNTEAGEQLNIRGSTTTLENLYSRPQGRRNLKFGGIFVWRRPGRFNEEVPIFRYRNAQDFIANRPNRVTFTFGQPRYFGRAWELGFFIQEDVRISQRLVVNMGLRYEYYGVFQERDGRLFNPDGIFAAVARPVVFRPSDSIYRGDKNNFLPRLGLVFALDSSQKTVIRAGAGYFTAPPNLRALAGLVLFDPRVPTRFRFDSAADITRFNLKYPLSNAQAMNIVANLDVPRGFNVVDPDNRDPYSIQWNFDIQRQLGREFVLQTGYVGNRGLAGR